MIRLARASPSPHPRFRVVKPGLNTIGIFDRGIARPVSDTSIHTLLSLPLRLLIVIVPLLPISATAFLQRFSITHSNRGTLTQASMSSESAYTSMFTFDETRGRR